MGGTIWNNPTVADNFTNPDTGLHTRTDTYETHLEVSVEDPTQVQDLMAGIADHKHLAKALTVFGKAGAHIKGVAGVVKALKKHGHLGDWTLGAKAQHTGKKRSVLAELRVSVPLADTGDGEGAIDHDQVRAMKPAALKKIAARVKKAPQKYPGLSAVIRAAPRGK